MIMMEGSATRIYNMLIISAVLAEATIINETTTETPMDSCRSTSCPENAVCVDDYGYISCECKVGKTGFNCLLDDPCLLNTTNCPADSVCYGNCRPNTVCEGATGVAHCHGCVAGWKGPKCRDDVDECANSVPACLNDGECKNTMGDFNCICQSGWTGKQCDCQKGDVCDIEDDAKDDLNTKPENGSPRSLLLDTSITVILILYALMW